MTKSKILYYTEKHIADKYNALDLKERLQILFTILQDNDIDVFEKVGEKLGYKLVTGDERRYIPIEERAVLKSEPTDGIFYDKKQQK